MLAGIVALNLGGCSWSSFLFSSKSEDPVVLIDNPPMRMVYSGKFTENDRKMFMMMLAQMDRIPYVDHTYRFPIGASISINEASSISTSSNFKSAMNGSKKAGVPK